MELRTESAEPAAPTRSQFTVAAEPFLGRRNWCEFLAADRAQNGSMNYVISIATDFSLVSALATRR